MDKQYMLSMLSQRIEELEALYRGYFDFTSYTYGSAASMRSRIKKQLYQARLLEYLIMRCPDTMTIEDKDLCQAFDMLVEPRRK